MVFAEMPPVCLNIRRLFKLVLLLLVMPLSISISLDIILDLLPWLTLIVSLISIPLASIVITRATLSELDKVIQQVAPKLPDDLSDEEAPKDVPHEPATPECL